MQRMSGYCERFRRIDNNSNNLHFFVGLVIHTHYDPTTTMTQEKFAFGTDCIDDVQCPATTAGFNRHDNALRTVVRYYDNRVRKSPITDKATGTIGQQKAKEVWHDVIDTLEINANKAITTEDQVMKLLTVAQKVDEELNW